MNPRLSKNDTASLYSREYFTPTQGDTVGYSDYPGDKEILKRDFSRLLKLAERDISIGTLLDVGCATGFLLETARERGWAANGVELSEYAAGVARSSGFEVFSGEIAEAPFGVGAFDLITCLGTIEHSTDPMGALVTMRRLIREDGLLVLSTPDVESLVGGRRFQFKPREHLVYFSRSTATKMLEKAGFAIMDIRQEWLRKPVRFVSERLTQYFPNPVTESIDRLIAKSPFAAVELPVPTGQMIITARPISDGGR